MINVTRRKLITIINIMSSININLATQQIGHNLKLLSIHVVTTNKINEHLRPS